MTTTSRIVSVLSLCIALSFSLNANAGEWVDVAGDELRNALADKTWKHKTFTLHFHSDGTRVVEQIDGKTSNDKWTLESDDSIYCIEGEGLDKLCAKLQTKGKRPRFRFVALDGPTAGKNWNVKIEDGAPD